MANVQNALLAVKALNGVICVYKPSGIKVDLLKSVVIQNICTDLNKMELRPSLPRVVIEGPTNEKMVVRQVENLADNILVVGPRYQKQDFKLTNHTYLGKQTSGVLLLGINDGRYLTNKLHIAGLTRAFKVKGELGKASENFYRTGKIVEKASYKHLQRSNIDSILSYMQAMHQKKMFEMCGVDMQSQAAYELASQGPLRPINSKIPVIYGLKCVEFHPPFFTLEIQSIGEREEYLHGLVHDLGIQLKTVALCHGVQCIRHGIFNLGHALLKKHWQVPHIIDNLLEIDKLLVENSRLLNPHSAALA